MHFDRLLSRPQSYTLRTLQPLLRRPAALQNTLVLIGRPYTVYDDYNLEIGLNRTASIINRWL